MDIFEIINAKKPYFRGKKKSKCTPDLPFDKIRY